MSQPASYDRIASFTNLQALSPSTPLPGSTVDAEFNAVKVTLDETLANLARIQRDDGALANDSVGLDQLSSEVTVGFSVPTVWVTATAYATSNTAFHGSAFYRCLVAHTSGVFATDLAALKWELIVDLSTIATVTATQVAVTPSGNLTTNVQTSLVALDAAKAATSHTHPASAISDSTTAGRNLLTAADVPAQQTLLGITSVGFQSGDIKPTAAITLQSGWYWCNGATKSRAGDAALFAAITISQTGTTANSSAVVTALSDTSNMSPGMFISGANISAATTLVSIDSATQVTMSATATGTATSTLCVAPHGIGDGTTTFTLPDYSGYGMIGRETMGAVAATNIGQVSTNITTTSGSATATVASATGLVVGMYVSAARVPSGTVIIAISGTTLTLGANATATVGPVAARFSTVRDAQTLGAAGGAPAVTLSQANLPNVNFVNSGIAVAISNGGLNATGLKSNGVSGGSGSSSAVGSADGATGSVVNSPALTVSVTAQGTAASGGSGLAVNNTPPSRVVNFIIKA